jgi:C4-dicarboxylate-specific signal transduction histidine kinase
MRTHERVVVRWLLGLAAVLAIGACAGPMHKDADADSSRKRPVEADHRIALHSLMSLADGHLQKIADVYTILATMDSVRSAQWEQIQEPLAAAARVNVPAVYWFALPDGSYWTLNDGRAAASLADRAYFPRALAGETIIGEMVVSRATGRSAAIVAHPVRGDDDTVVGVLGASVYLDRLSEIINKEMDLGPDLIFFSLDQTPVVGLHKDPETIFVHPLEEEDPQLTNAIRGILSSEQGVVTYRFRGQGRTIYHRRSPVTGWWYGFGELSR